MLLKQPNTMAQVMQLQEFLNAFTKAVDSRDWMLVSELDQQMQAVVDTEKSAALELPKNSQNNNLAALDSDLKQLSSLYQQAQLLAATERDIAAKKLEELSLGKAGISKYKHMSAL